MILFHWFFVGLTAPFLIGVIARVKALVSGKVGPSLFQPYFDLIKLFSKQCVYSHGVTWVFRISPAVTLAAMLIVCLLVPFGSLKAPVQFSGDILLIVAVLSLSRFFMIAAALDTGFSLEGLGASREAFFACLSEVALFMCLIALTLLARRMSLSGMLGADSPLSWNLLGPALLMVVASLFIVMLAENCRIPVDDPDTHLELTMIHEVMLLEHSGVDLAYMYYAAIIKFFIFGAILVPIILPVQTIFPFINTLIFAGGMIGLAALVGLVESSMARIRLNRVRNLLLIAFALAFFGLIVTLWRGAL
ncbi:MAG: NADH-quinone oxidoreductase subunit H [Candidatus Omnitrophica bacterium]|nr:NADH-quinone oxidoreductase subunit H [Candidatus Omnitrophota bacterium]